MSAFRMKHWLTFFCGFLLPLFAMAQNNNKGSAEPYAPQWKKIDSLIDRGMPQSATTLLTGIYAQAKTKGQTVQMIKAQLYLMQVASTTLEDADSIVIAQVEREIGNSSFPANAIWQSLGAQLYWEYYRSHRWEIMNRTRTGETGDDFRLWDAAKYAEKASSLYQASLSRAEELRRINIEQYDPLLRKGVNTRSFRPTLYDLLAFRAVGFFENDERTLTQPATRFVMNDPAAFAPAAEFAAHTFRSADSSSLHWQALRLYQQIITQHKNDTDPLLDADLLRLQFVYNHYTGPNKKEAYRKALERIQAAHPRHPLAGLAAYRLAALINEAAPERPLRRGPRSTTQSRVDHQYPLVKGKLEEIIHQYPGTEGAALAQQMLNDILFPELSVETENAVLPGEASKILVRYRNLPKVWVRIVKADGDQFFKGAYNRQEYAARQALRNPVLRSFSAALPGTGDYEQHSTELKIEALPLGTYAIIVSGNESFSENNNFLACNIVQSTRLGMVVRQDAAVAIPDGYVLDRKTGRAIAGASIQLHEPYYDAAKQAYSLRQKAQTASGEDGSFKVPLNNTSSYLSVRKGDDVYYSDNYLSFYRYQPEEKPEQRTFFFTDRSIYRPGQTIYYKGITLISTQVGRSQQVVANTDVSVSFYDPNHQLISTQKLKTNEYGSFTGSFKAPENGVTGYMQIESRNGSTSVSVEEYKRPKFKVSFDTLKATYALNETVRVKGRAMAYAGNAIDGAAVQYRVVREARFPFWWCYWRYGGPSSPSQEIAAGTATTGADGSFDISFSTIPDETVPEESLPVFTYTVYADVTDINGETRSGEQGLSAGYRALQFNTMVPQKALADVLDTLHISTENLNGTFVPADVHISIARLQSPSSVYRQRLWEAPDQFVMSEAEFRRDFPLDEYKEEGDYLHWRAEAPLWEKTVRTSKEGQVPVNASFRENGWYVITLKASDKNGKAIEEKLYVQVWNRNSRSLPGIPLAMITDGRNPEPGQQAQAWVSSGYEDAQVVELVTRMNTNANSSRTVTAPAAWSKAVTEEDRGGIGLQYLMVRENRMYTVGETIAVPWSNKDLGIRWETHRDKLLPGQQETWTLVIEGRKKEKIAAELVAGLYDASLDAFRPHDWAMSSLFPTLNPPIQWNQSAGFGWSYSTVLSYADRKTAPAFEKSYDELIVLPTGQPRRHMFLPPGSDSRKLEKEMVAAAAPVQNLATTESASVAQSKDAAGGIETPGATEQKPAPSIVPRSNLRETAFFFPQLKTDAEGNVRISFTIPEALTEWRLLAFAHTQQMATGYLSGQVKTQKDLMVVPGLPRFFRQGDDLVLSTKISNLSGKALNGTATLELLDAQTLRPLNLPFRLSSNSTPFSAPAGQSTAASWNIHVPESLYEPVVVRITARAGDFTDGEENTLPVITNRMLVTETMPLWINGNGSKDFNFSKLLQSGSSNTLAQHALTVEYTGNPAWYAVQALPYLMEYPYECAEQTFNRYYANALAAHILSKAPRVKEIFRQWEQLDTAALMSNLQKNQELKSALLEETPWVLEAQNETEQKKRIALLFDAARLASGLNSAARKLDDMMLGEGGFPWFKGNHFPDQYITQYIVTGIGRLQHLGVRNDDRTMAGIAQRALPYLDKKMQESYDRLVKSKADLRQQHIDYYEVQYLYMRSFFPGTAVAEKHRKAFNYFSQQAKQFWPRFNPYMKGMIALALQRNGDKATSAQIIASLKETAQHKEEMGMYWLQRGNSYWWYEAPIEAQALLIECFEELTDDQASVDAMRLWLLKQKQTQNWPTSKATADACYALLLSGSQWLSNDPSVSIRLGDQNVSSGDRRTQAGTGYFKTRFEAAQVKPDMGRINVTVQSNDKNTSWGAVYWQYFENLDKISSAATPLVVRKQLFIERNTAQGPVLEAITADRPLKVGDKVKVRLEIVADRDMEYVHLKDMRASCFEPVNVLSGYRWQGGLGYYESTKDVSSNFFISYLRKGHYVFEYPMFVTHKGDFSNGIATIQCMYAPEFSAHSEGIRVKVQ